MLKNQTFNIPKTEQMNTSYTYFKMVLLNLPESS